MKIPEEFDEISPYEPEEMKQAFDDLLKDRQFQLVLKGFAPWLPKKDEKKDSKKEEPKKDEKKDGKKN